MKIIHVIKSIDPKMGGPAQVVVRLAAAQAGQGHDVHIAAYSDPDADRRIEKQIARVPYFAAVRIHKLPQFGIIDKLFATVAKREIDLLLSGTEFVHLHGIWEPLLRVAAEMAYARKVPYCFRPAGMLDPWSLAQRKWKKKLAMALGTRRSLQRAAFLHSLNADEANLIAPLHLGVPSLVIPNGVFLEEIEPLPAPGTFRAAHPEIGDQPFVLFLSRLHFKKGLDYLADAFALIIAKYSSVRLVVAGPDEGAKSKFEEQIRSYGLSNRVHLVGGLYGRDKFAALVDAACFCLPSRQEGFSVAVLEALAAGVPVVISTECHFPDVQRCGAGAIIPLDPAEIAAAIYNILSDQVLGNSMSKAGKALIRVQYTWPRISENTIRAYKDSMR